MNIEIKKIEKKDKSVLQNLFQLYLHDITRSLHMEVNNHGLFEYDYIDDYWKKDNYEPYFIYVDNNLAGFVLIDDEFMVLNNEKNKYDLSEFFILNYYRRKGIGKKVVNKIFNDFKGNWEVRPIPKSDEAFCFWSNVINEYTNGNYKITSIPEDNRKVITFNNEDI